MLYTLLITLQYGSSMLGHFATKDEAISKAISTFSREAVNRVEVYHYEDTCMITDFELDINKQTTEEATL